MSNILFRGRLAGVIELLGGIWIGSVPYCWWCYVSRWLILVGEFDNGWSNYYGVIKTGYFLSLDTVKQIRYGYPGLGEISIKQLNDGLNNITIWVT